MNGQISKGNIIASKDHRKNNTAFGGQAIFPNTNPLLARFLFLYATAKIFFPLSTNDNLLETG